MTDFVYYFRRVPWGTDTNVPRRIAYHSPTGFEWGYGGSAPADLALNMLDDALSRLGWDGDLTSINGVDCFDLAHKLHQTFKWEFVATLPYEGGEIPLSAIAEWLRKRGVNLSTTTQDANPK